MMGLEEEEERRLDMYIHTHNKAKAAIELKMIFERRGVLVFLPFLSFSVVLGCISGIGAPR